MGFFVAQQMGREYSHLKRIFNERSSRQGANQYTERASVTGVTEAPPTRRAAEVLGISHQTANKAEKVVIAIDKLKAQGETATAICAPGAKPKRRVQKNQ